MFKTLWVTTILAAILALAAAAVFTMVTAPQVNQQPMQETSTSHAFSETGTSVDSDLTTETEHMLSCPDHQLEGRYPEVSACPHFPIMCHGGCKRAGFDTGYCRGEICQCVNWSQRP